MRKRLTIVGVVLVVLSILPAVGSIQADAAYRSVNSMTGGSAAAGQGGWVLFWVLIVAGAGALVAAWLMGGKKPQP